MIKATKIVLKILLFKVIHFFSWIPFTLPKTINNLKAYFGHYGMQEYWKSYPNNKNNRNKVIIYGLRTYATHHQAVFEKVSSDFFRFNGANVKNLVCGNVLPSCDGDTAMDSKVLCYICRKERKYHIKNFPNDFIYFNQFISKSEVEQINDEVENLSDGELENYQYMGVNVGRHALDSVEFAFQFLFDKNNVLHLRKLRDSVYRGMITVKVAKNLHEIEKPTHLLTLHGCYTSWGPFSEYLGRQGVNVYVFGMGWTPGLGYLEFNKWTLNEDKMKDVRKDVPAKTTWEQKKNEPLLKEQKEQIHSFLLKRKEGKSFDYLTFYEKKNGMDDEFIKSLNSTRKKFVLYMHSLWDRGFEDVASDCFEGHIEWLRETIEYFMRNRKDAYLFIKPHPAEYSVWDYQKHGGGDVILNLFNKLPDNIILMQNNLPFTSYDLMDKGCIGITYFGTVGLEYSFFKKPVLVAGNTHYTDPGVVYKIKSKNEYFQLIDNPDPLYIFPHASYDIIEKYAYHYIFRQNMRIPFYKDDMWLGHCIDWEVLKNYKYFIENDKAMNHIVNSILNNIDVVNID